MTENRPFNLNVLPFTVHGQARGFVRGLMTAPDRNFGCRGLFEQDIVCRLPAIPIRS